MKKPQLTNDARAVLLEAELPSASVPRAFIFRRGDLRPAEFERGSERLKAMQLLEGETAFLTPEGERLARELQENNARLLEGIRFADREAAIILRGGRDTAAVEDEWFETEIDGQAVFTNGKFLTLGRTPSENRMRRPPSPSGIAFAWEHCLGGEPQEIFPVAYSESEGYKWRYRIVHFSDGSALCCEIYNFITNRYPDARWTHSAERKHSGFARGFNVYSGERRVAIAGTNSTEPSAAVQALIDAATQPEPAATDQVVKVDEPPQDSPASNVSCFDSSNAVQLSLLDKAA